MTDPRAINIGSLDAGEPSRELVAAGSNAKYANGHLVFLREGTLVAHAFDAERLELRGEPVSLVEEVQIAGPGSTGVAGAFTVSDTGVLAYQSGFAVRSQLAWFDRSGARTRHAGRSGRLRGRVAVAGRFAGGREHPGSVARDSRDSGSSISRAARASGLRSIAETTSRPSGRGRAATAWCSAHAAKGPSICTRSPRAAAAPKSCLLQDPLGKFASHWSADGRFITYIGGGGIIVRSDLWVLPLSRRSQAVSVSDTTFVESQGQFSPDGRWMAYMSNESGRQEVYVRPFPGPGDKWLVSSAGGGWPRWRRDGREIFYLARDGTLMAVSVDAAGSSFVVGAGRPLFKVRLRPMVRLDAYRTTSPPTVNGF